MTRFRVASPQLQVGHQEVAVLGRTLAGIDVEDESLHNLEYQARVLANVRGAAGPSFDEIAREVAERLATAPWWVIVRGLPVEHATTILVALSASFGELVEPYRQPWSRFVRNIVPSRDRVVGGRVLNEFLHTDGTDWIEPNDWTCLFCVRPDQSADGISRLLDVATLLDQEFSRENSLLVERIAAQPLPWRIADELGGGVHWAPAINIEEPRIRWLRYTVSLSCEEGLASLDHGRLKDLRAFEQLIESCDGIETIELEPGDLLVIDNNRCLHARTAIENSIGSTRELRRTKVQRTAGRR